MIQIAKNYALMIYDINLHVCGVKPLNLWISKDLIQPFSFFGLSTLELFFFLGGTRTKFWNRFSLVIYKRSEAASFVDT